jgi:hypothetical protein
MTLPIPVDFLSNEWAPVICIGVAFFLVQLFLSILFSLGIRGQERAIKRLFRDFKQGGDWRSGARALSRRHAWVQWVVDSFPTDSRSPGNFTREDALLELDTRIASDGNYLLLQRMGVMAPLLGVVLTVAGFYWLKVGDDDQSLDSILSAVTPLVGGVGTGAVLALINQLLLHIAGRRVESLRMTARTWFDTVIWDNSNRDTQASPVNALQAMEHFIRGALDDMNRLSDTLAQASEIGAAMSALPGQIRRIMERKLSANQSPASTTQGGRSATPLPRPAAVTRPISNK